MRIREFAVMATLFAAVVALIVTQVAEDGGGVNLTHEEYGIMPFGE